MPRGRMLNKTISVDEEIAKLSDKSIILYTFSIPHLDVEGKILADSAILKGVVVPYLKNFSQKMIENCVKELGSTTLVCVYGNEHKYMKFLGFDKNQSHNKDKEAPSEIPDPTPEQLQSNSRVTPPKDKINSKEKEKTVKHLDFVYITDFQYNQLISQFTKSGADERIARLNDYLGSSGKKYKSHYHTILNWARREGGEITKPKKFDYPTL